MTEHHDGWLLGAGKEKIASILKTTVSIATRSERTFLDRLPALRHVKEELIPGDARRGYFVGLDGRKVVCASEHLMLAGYLQNGEKVVMAHANVKWKQDLKAEGLIYRQVNMVHDEYVTETPIIGLVEYDKKGNPFTKEAVRIAELQCNAIEWAGKELGVLCPLAGKSAIGFNWQQVH